MGKTSFRTQRASVVVTFMYYFNYTTNVEYVTVSAKVRRELYEKLKMYSIPISSVIKKALEEEVRKREEEEIRRKLAEVQAILRKIPEEEIVEALRESREER